MAKKSTTRGFILIFSTEETADDCMDALNNTINELGDNQTISCITELDQNETKKQWLKYF